MKLHNTLTRVTGELRPLTPGHVLLYTCGPTVYDYAHIGNLRAYVFDDILRRALEANSYQVKHIMNITDVGHLVSDEDEGEDKLEKGAAREHKTVEQVADFYISAFKDDVAELNILPPNGYQSPHGIYARATDFIEEQKAIVRILLDKEVAYITKEAIYFDVSKLKDYGKLTGQKISDKEVGARAEVVTDEAKRHPADFALWFFKVGRFADHSMSWGSDWGDGFPGWHLECSAIIHATLGEPIDIHTGGVDHIGTHHTNEIAQTEAAFGVELAKYWVHNEHLLINGQKMSKSLGNFATLADIKDKGYGPLALRTLFLQAHYRSQMNFTWEALDAAQAYLKNLERWADSSKQSIVSIINPSDESLLKDEIQAALADDLNTAQALAQINKFIDRVAPTPALLSYIDKTLGLQLADRPDISEAQKLLITQREKARSSQAWDTADNIRAKLQEQAIEINDTDDGSVWYRS
jgi:cysteinyl-tRNA synthetase